MKKMTLAAMKYGIAAIILGLTIFQTSVTTQVPIQPDGRRIEGTWDIQLTFRNCSTGAVTSSSQSFVSYTRGGVLIDISRGAAPSSRYPGLGVWNHIRGREYVATFKQFRYNPDGTFAGKTIVVNNIRHEMDDTLTTSAVGTFYNASDVVVATVCPTGVGTRFTGEN